MIRLMNYGKRIETSIYLFKNGKLNSVNYDYKDKNDIIIDIHERNGSLWRRATFTGGYSDVKVNNYDLNINESVLFNKLEDLGNIIVMRYDTAIYRNNKQFAINIEKSDGKNVSLYIDNKNIAVWNKSINTINVYRENNDYEVDYSSIVEKIIVTDFGIIDINISERSVTVIYNNGDIESYKYNEFYSDIDCLRNQCNIISAIGDKFKAVYSVDGLVESITCNNEVFSRSEIELIKINSTIEQQQFICETIYPTMISENFLNYKYKYLKLWSHDRMVKSQDGDIVSFERKTYIIDNLTGLLELLRSNTDKLTINY